MFESIQGKCSLLICSTCLLFLLTTACADTDKGDLRSRFTVADSAGIQVVTNGRVGARGADPIPLRETLRIGSREGEEGYNLYRVRGVAVGPGDTLFIPLMRELVIQVYAPDGRHVRTIGRAGEGPGEFRGLSTVFVIGDTIVVNDPRLYRTTLLRTTGELLTTFGIRKGNKWLWPSAHTPSGWLVSLTDVGIFEYVPGQVVVRTSKMATVRDIPAAVSELEQGSEWPPSVSQVLEYSLGRRFGMPMGPTTTERAPLWEPYQRYAVDGMGCLYLTQPEIYRIDVIDSDGNLVRHISRMYDPVPISRSMGARFLSAVTAHYDTIESRPTEFAVDPVQGYRERANLPSVPNLPALGRILVSPSGAILVERTDLVENPVALEWTQLGRQRTHWDYFNPEGRFEGMVSFEANFTPRTLTDAAVYGVLRDELDVEFVVRYTFD